MIDWSNFESTVVIEVTRPSGKYTCSGVAIKNNIILTAAHCLEGEILETRVFNQASYDPNAKSFKVSGFQIHPRYNKKKSNYHSDLAKIRLSEPLPDTTKFFPIIKKTTALKGKIVRLGFGARTTANIRTLIQPEFKALNPKEDVLELHDMYSYSGDSGGPIFLQNDGQMYLIAIHSTLSYGPEGKFSFNPLISEHRDWAFASL